MSNQHALIYFIHDDIDTEFEGILNSNILKANIPSTIKAYLVYNVRIIEGSAVRYKTSVNEIITAAPSATTLKPLPGHNIWQDAFKFIFAQLNEQGLDQNVSLIALSHAAGIVINRNGETLPVIGFNKNRNLATRLKSKMRVDNNRYIIKTPHKDSIFIATKTVVDLSVKNNASKNTFRKQYIRKNNIDYCRSYEGLFTFQLSKFFKEQGMKFESIIFSNCNIQVYDNGFLFAPVSSFTIGAESNSNMHTWDFPIIINTINSQLNASPETRAREIFKECLKHFATINRDTTYRYYLTRNDKFNTLHVEFEKIIELILKEIKDKETYKNSLLNWVRSARATNDDVPLFDAMTFFRIANQFINTKFDAQLNTFEQILQNEIVIGRSSGDPACCGYSLYLPRTKQQFESIKGGICNYFSQQNANDFTLNSAYEEFLTGLFG